MLNFSRWTCFQLIRGSHKESEFRILSWFGWSIIESWHECHLYVDWSSCLIWIWKVWIYILLRQIGWTFNATLLIFVCGFYFFDLSESLSLRCFQTCYILIESQGQVWIDERNRHFDCQILGTVKWNLIFMLTVFFFWFPFLSK